VPGARYHHGQLRQALIDAAVEAVREEGAEGWSLRDLCRRVGVSHNAAYHHFSHRDELVAAVAELTIQRLVEALQGRIDGVQIDDPVARVRTRLMEVGRGYVAFAIGDPHLFRLAFLAAAQPRPGTTHDLLSEPLGILSGVLDELVSVGYLAEAARPGAEITCWSTVHGFSILSLDGPLRDVDEAERQAVLTQVLDTIDRSYGATTGGSDEAPAARDVPC
jgi:AcrR family transcriptional regulator